MSSSPKNCVQESVLKGVDNAPSEYQKLAQRVDNALSLKRLSFCEDYIVGNLAVFFELDPFDWPEGRRRFRTFAGAKADTVINSNGLALASVQYEAVDCCSDSGGSQDDVLVSIVQDTETVETSVPSRVWLYFIENEIEDFTMRRNAQIYMSVDGTFKRNAILTERELCIPVNSSAVQFGQDTVGVIERTSEVVQNVPYDCRNMMWKLAANFRNSCSLRLGRYSFELFMNVGEKSLFELVEVTFGPFNLQPGAE